MGRKRRPYLPGAIFHLTTRTQGHEPWFTPTLRSRMVTYLASVLSESDAALLAYAIMPNHLHLVLRQGSWPLGRIMQMFLRRTALLVQRSHGVEGHVFERPFKDRPCHDPAYARNMIVYTNLNPPRAGLVDYDGRYAWCSHAFYLGDRRPPPAIAAVLAVDQGLRLFATREYSSLGHLRTAYRAFVEWRVECDEAARSGKPGARDKILPPPSVLARDTSWSRSFVPLFRTHAATDQGDPGAAEARADLEAIARGVLAELAGDLPLEQVRCTYKGQRVVRVRRAMILRMSAAGHAGAAIARYLRVSDQCVSKVLRSRTRAAPA